KGHRRSDSFARTASRQERSDHALSRDRGRNRIAQAQDSRRATAAGGISSTQDRDRGADRRIAASAQAAQARGRAGSRVASIGNHGGDQRAMSSLRAAGAAGAKTAPQAPASAASRTADRSLATGPGRNGPVGVSAPE